MAAALALLAGLLHADSAVGSSRPSNRVTLDGRERLSTPPSTAGVRLGGGTAGTASLASLYDLSDDYTLGLDASERAGFRLLEGDAAGERIAMAYDSLGRLLTRSELGPVPSGGSDGDRPFIAKRILTWDGARLAAESGLNFSGDVLWRQQLLPGASGMDDAPQVRVENLTASASTIRSLDAPTVRTFTLLRDELGSVGAIAEEQGSAPPTVLARFLYAPYGGRHIERGPELLEVRFDATVVTVGGVTQTTTPNQTLPGSLVIRTTMPLDPASFDAGLVLEHWNTTQSQWEAAPKADFAIGLSADDHTNLLVMAKAGWPKGERYRITLEPSLKDPFGRLLRMPEGQVSGVEALLEVPSDGVTPPAYARRFELEKETAEARTLGGAIPGGFTHGFQGMWTDPTVGISYARNRWLDTRTGQWLSQDPLGDIDSPNLYGFVANQPWMASDPMGLEVSVSQSGWVIIADPRTGKIRKISPAEVAADPAAVRTAIGVEGQVDPREADEIMKRLGQGAVVDNGGFQSVARAGQLASGVYKPMSHLAAAWVTAAATAGSGGGVLASGKAGAIYGASERLIENAFNDKPLLGGVPRSAAGGFVAGVTLHGAGKAVGALADTPLGQRVVGAVAESPIGRGLRNAAETVLSPRIRSGIPSPLRMNYEAEVRALEDVGLNARASGADPEAVARMLIQMRRDLGIKYKGMTPAEELARITARNIREYGDPLGPTVEWFRRAGRSWDEIIESASRPGGKDLGY